MYELLAAAIEYQLSQPPAHAGMRLKTVRELARMVGVSHEWMNKSLGGLVERGILVRKHGSGVYVRKVPPADGRTLDPKWEKKLQNIFANDPVVTCGGMIFHWASRAGSFRTGFATRSVNWGIGSGPMCLEETAVILS